MVKGANADKKRRKLYRRLIKVANEVFWMGDRSLLNAPDSDNLIVVALLRELERFLELTTTAILQCERRILNDEKVQN